MTKTHVILEDRAMPLAGYPHARRAGDFVYLCGTSSRRPDNTHDGVTVHDDGSVELDIAEQTRAVIENMRTILKAAGGDLRDLVDVTTFLVDMQDFGGYNEVYNEYFEATTGPARTTVAVAQLPHPNLLIEMKGIAYLPTGARLP
jgi:2-aminomuconate deaminase